MKRKVFIILAVLCAAVCSCDKISGSSDKGGGETVIIDPAIIGTWEIIKYGAIEQGQTQEGRICDNRSEILSSYHKFDFNGNAIMKLSFGNPEEIIEVDFYYDSTYKTLLFGDSGYADVETLNGTDLIFTSDSFMPLGWYEDATVKNVRVYCKKMQQSN